MSLQTEIINELGVKPTIDPKEEIRKSIDFMKAYLKKYPFLKTFVLGISGGQDSTLAGRLAQLTMEEMREETKDEKYMRSALNYIQNGYFREGLNVLEQVEDRRGQWYYYSAFANYRVGNNAIALDHARTACAFEPDNPYYANLLRQLQGGEARYQQRSARYGGNPSMQGSNYCGQICGTFLCMSLCCSGGRMGLPILCCI